MNQKIYTVDFKILKYNNDQSREQDCYLAAGYFLTEHCKRFRQVYSAYFSAYRLTFADGESPAVIKFEAQDESFTKHDSIKGFDDSSLTSIPTKDSSVPKLGNLNFYSVYKKKNTGRND